MSSAALFITAQEMMAMRNTLEEMKWTQPKSPIQTDNSATDISPRKLKTMDCHLHWLRCREAQGQFRYYWASRSLNWGDRSTKHHPPPLYHELKIIQFAGNPDIIKENRYQ